MRATGCGDYCRRSANLAAEFGIQSGTALAWIVVLCDLNPPTVQTDARTDGRTDGRHARSISTTYVMIRRAKN